MLYIDFALILGTAIGLICSIRWSAPRPFRDPPRHLLICCAHSDDCVITGAEYACEAIKAGLSVRVAYLTCSAPHPGSEIAKLRKTEALKAWSKLSVPQENFTFINLSESPVGGPVTYSDEDIANAVVKLKTLILSLPQSAAMIIPAQGEYHVDHRTVRKAALCAITESGRVDILAYESPEYNAFLSLLHSPNRTIRAVLRSVPVLKWFVRPYSGRSNYVEGSSGFIFSGNYTHLATKKHLLGCFSSQDGDLLVRLFGYETLYRPLLLTKIPRVPNRALFISAFGGYCDLSTLALALTLLGIAFLTAHEVARGLTTALSPTLPINNYLLLLSSLSAGAYCVRRFRRTASLESALFVWVAALGLIFGAL